MKDMVFKGRSNAGQKHYKSVLNDDLVRKLRSEYTPGDSWMSLEKKYGINRGVIRSAVLGLTRRDVS